MGKRHLMLLLVAAMVLTAFAGCSTGPAPSGPSGEEPKETELVIAIKADVSTLHPSDHRTTSEIDVETQIYDTLYKVSREGKTPEPRLATSYEIGSDGMTYTFHLREDATFHDGTPVKASDVVFSAKLYEQSIYQNATVAGMESVEATDDYTVVFKTSSVYTPFLESIMGMHVASEAYYNSVDDETFAMRPLGSGPYKFVDREVGNKIVLEAYEDYYLGEAPIKKVIYRVIPDDTTIAVGLQTGEIDFAEIAESSYATLEGKEGVTIDKFNMSRFGFISVNHEKYPFSEVKFRQAIAYAIDREKMVEVALDGFGTVNSNILSPLRFGYSEDQPKYTYDPERAKELLRECGIETPYDLGVMYISEAFSTQAQLVQSDLEAIGLNTTIEILEANAYYAKLMGGECGISVLAMTLEGNTQEYSLAFLPQYIGGANNARYKNDQVTQWFEDAVKAVDEDERFEIYDKIFTKVQEDAVYIVLYNSIGLYAYNSNLQCHEFELEGAYHVREFSWK
ncbi:MAG: ABC transporter substrate-binding protein [Bacillota bacterium]